MTSRQTAWAGIAIVFVIAVLTAAATAQQFKSKASKGNPSTRSSNPVPQGDDAGAFALVIRTDPRIVGEAAALHEKIAKRLTAAKLPPPEWRIKHYSSLNHKDFPQVIGWQGMITNAKETPNGVLVDVRVSVKLDMAYDSYYVIERYLLRANTIQFVGSDTPVDSATRAVAGL